MSWGSTDPGAVSTTPSPLRDDLPAWAEPHMRVLQAMDLTGVDLEEQIRFLVSRGLTPERALRLVLALPPPVPAGHLARVRRAGQLVNHNPARFWPVVESLSVYWQLHPWSILGEPLRYDLSRGWAVDLGGPWPEKGLACLGSLNRYRSLPPRVCARRVLLIRFRQARLSLPGWVVGDLELIDCRRLEAMPEGMTLLGALTVEKCPRFQREDPPHTP